jgi:hypothetical protein
MLHSHGSEDFHGSITDWDVVRICKWVQSSEERTDSIFKSNISSVEHTASIFSAGDNIYFKMAVSKKLKWV